MKSDFLRGMSHGIPVGLGYLSVSFGFGISAVRSGLSVLEASVISAVNLTSAGQVAGIEVIAQHGTIIAMILSQLTINIRYSLMALSLSQKLDRKFTIPHRLLASYGITDEIFAICSAQSELIVPAYMYGIILISAVGWILGTFLGAYAGQLMPETISSAMGILLYGMFLAIIIPPSRKHKNILCVVIASAVLSIIFRYCITAISSVYAVIICAVVSASIGAVLFPVPDEESA
ncbi:MAG: AzlC family ABC transporter permease [Ruminococcus sp.]|nr:AzlC family ABC transporter permease [Ruminococcus sp.]